LARCSNSASEWNEFCRIFALSFEGDGVILFQSYANFPLVTIPATPCNARANYLTHRELLGPNTRFD